MALVLVVDDAQFMRMRLKKLLTDGGHQVVEAGNGFEALEQYETHKPDVVLMDITMPDMDGLTALKEMKKQWPDAKVVMCSALGQQSRSEEHTSELQSRENIVCRPLLEK